MTIYLERILQHGIKLNSTPQSSFSATLSLWVQFACPLILNQFVLYNMSASQGPILETTCRIRECDNCKLCITQDKDTAVGVNSAITSDDTSCQTILDTGKTVIGQGIQYPSGSPLITSKIVTIPVGAETGPHIHEYPRLVILYCLNFLLDFYQKSLVFIFYTQ